jgi:hydrogenase nickel incorporation protein HypA/HybF
MALAACPACGAVDVEVAGHEDVVLESITVDAPAGRNR